jgi:ABC-type nitrate/sulfonate/bicarbonate transport system substrate-binding protein
VPLLVVLAVTVGCPSSALARERLKVLVPEKDNLQYLAFWVAKASGAFDRQGIDLELLVAPPASKGGGTPPVDGMLANGEADAAVLTPTVYLRMIGAKTPVVLVANLFKNEPYGLVVRREVAETRQLSPSAPLRDRMAGLKGATIGYPPAAFSRLRALLASQGLDLEKDVRPRVLLARDQNDAFKDKTLDAAFLATPHLEKAATSGDGVVIVNLARGEAPELAMRQTHVLGVARRTYEARRDAILGAVRAIAEAEKLIHSAQGQVVDALVRELPGRDRRELETIVALYEPATPATAEVHAEDIAPALALVPEGGPKPDLTGVDLAPFVASDLAAAAAASTSPSADRRPRWVAIGIGLFLFVVILLVWRRRRAAR